MAWSDWLVEWLYGQGGLGGPGVKGLGAEDNDVNVKWLDNKEMMTR